jgi:hypothetical protein
MTPNPAYRYKKRDGDKAKRETEEPKMMIIKMWDSDND